MTQIDPHGSTALPVTASTDIIIAPAKKLGRPLKEIDLEVVRTLAAKGMNLGQIAARLGCAQRTLMYKLSNDPEVRAAADEGRAAAIELAADTLWSRAMAGDNTCLIFWLRSIAKWSVKTEIDVVHHVEAPSHICITSHVMEMAAEQSRLLDMTDEEIEAEYSEIRRSADEPSDAELASLME